VVGMAQSLSGASLPAAKALKEKAQKWITALQSGILPHHMMWTALTWVIWPSLCYLLSVTIGNPASSSYITPLQTILPRLRTNRNYPMALCFGLPLHQGLGLPNPIWEQGILVLKLFLEHANSSHMESTLITISLEYTQLQIGSSLLVFNTNFAKWGFLVGPTWLTSLWQFISEHQIQLQSLVSSVPKPPQLNDRCIMDITMESGLSASDLCAINHCQIAHQAIFLSDVTTGWAIVLHQRPEKHRFFLQ